MKQRMLTGILKSPVRLTISLFVLCCLAVCSSCEAPNLKATEEFKDSSMLSLDSNAAVNGQPDSAAMVPDTALHSGVQSPQKVEKPERQRKASDQVPLSEKESLKPIYPIDREDQAPPFVSSTFFQNGSLVIFSYTFAQRARAGLSDSHRETHFTFEVVSPKDSFLLKNESLTKSNFKYTESGGLYWAGGENPEKGYIKGIHKADDTWFLELDIRIKIKDDVNPLRGKPVQLKRVFTH